MARPERAVSDGAAAESPDRHEAASGLAAGRPIRVLVADDHGLMRFGVVALLREAPDVAVVAEAADGPEAVRRYAEVRPDVALVDLKMPGLDGVGVVAQVRARYPDARLVMLDDVRHRRRHRARAPGGREGVPAQGHRSARPTRVRARGTPGPHVGVSGGGRKARRPPDAARADAAGDGRAAELAAGKSNKEIGAALGMAEGTAKLHVRHVYEKLGVQSRTEALGLALQRGLLRLPGA